MRFCVVLFTTLVGLSCDLTRANRNEATLRKHIAELLGAQSAQITVVSFQMSARSRTGFVSADIADDQCQKLITQLSLIKLTGHQATAARRDTLRAAAGNSPQFADLIADEANTELFATPANRPATLRFQDGSQFEYLRLYYDQRRGRVLIEVSYAYG